MIIKMDQENSHGHYDFGNTTTFYFLKSVLSWISVVTVKIHGDASYFFIQYFKAHRGVSLTRLFFVFIPFFTIICIRKASIISASRYFYTLLHSQQAKML